MPTAKKAIVTDVCAPMIELQEDRPAEAVGAEDEGEPLS